MVDIRVHVDSVVTKLGKLTGKEAKDILFRSFRDIGINHTNAVKKRQFGPYRGNSYSDKLQARTGGLRKGVGYKTKRGSGLGVQTRLFATGKAAVLQEHGGTIRPKRSKFLTIPLPAALTKAGAQSGKYKIRLGTASRSARSGASRLRHITDAGPTFIFKSKRGNLIVGITNPKTGKPYGSGGRITPFYVLKKQVSIPPRFGFLKTWKQLGRRFAARRLDRAGTELVNL